MGRIRGQADMSRVTIRYWAAAKEVAGVAEQAIDAETLAEALDVVLRERNENLRFREVLSFSSFLVDGSPTGHQEPELVLLNDGSEIEVLPPFAGG